MCERDGCVEPPSELHRPGLVVKLNKTMYGTQDASNAWLKLWREHFRSNGFELVASNPALYRSELVSGFCHGDDFVTGAAEQLDKELEVWHRSVRVVNELMENEADKKHVQQLLEDLGLTQSNIVKTPRVKLIVIEAEPIVNCPMLEGEQATTFRSRTMRCAYLALDRVDISEAIKCLARALSKPKAGRMTQLKRVARCLKGVPRKALQDPWKEPSSAHLEVHVDSDWAGDTATRRRRSGVIVRRGPHLLRHSSTVQSVIGLKGAESEYYALTKGVFRVGSAKLVCRLEPEATTLIAYGVFEREGSCFAKRSWQEHSSFSDEDADGYRNV